MYVRHPSNSPTEISMVATIVRKLMMLVSDFIVVSLFVKYCHSVHSLHSYFVFPNK
jgi:hypothetical protein